MIFNYFNDFEFNKDVDDPYVHIANNFDELRVPKNHPSRSKSDTFYSSDDIVLRTHMTCYLPSLPTQGYKSYILCGDVYRKDAIDATHYPVFHQIDGFCLVDDNEDVNIALRNKLTGLIKYIFGNDISYKILEDYENSDVYFPFTINSFEVEVDILDQNNNPKKLEVLGAGQVHPEIMEKLGLKNKKAYAFGLGLERLAMVLFKIPDIRLLWSEDKRFLDQFENNKITVFKPYSKYEICYKDVAFFINDNFTYNDLCAIARNLDKDNIIESIELKDTFVKNNKTSHCYRITYRSMDKTLTNVEIDLIQNNIRNELVNQLSVELR